MGDLLRNSTVTCRIQELEAGVHALIDNAYLPSAMGCGNPTNGWTYPKGKYVLADELQALLENEDE